MSYVIYTAATDFTSLVGSSGAGVHQSVSSSSHGNATETAPMRYRLDMRGWSKNEIDGLTACYGHINLSAQ
jgi:hypothetical protein